MTSAYTSSTTISIAMSVLTITTTAVSSRAHATLTVRTLRLSRAAAFFRRPFRRLAFERATANAHDDAHEEIGEDDAQQRRERATAARTRHAAQQQTQRQLRSLRSATVQAPVRGTCSHAGAALATCAVTRSLSLPRRRPSSLPLP
eukprot:678757-Pleurochrysis_carterae.AAC.1